MNVCVNRHQLSSMQVPPPPPTTEEKARAALREVLGASFEWLVSFDAPAEKIELQYTEAFSKLSMDGLESEKERSPLRVDIILPSHDLIIKELEKRSDYQEIAGAARTILEPYYNGQSPRRYGFDETIGNQPFSINVRADAGYNAHLATQKNNKPPTDSVSLDPCVIINQRPHMGWDYAVLQTHFGRCCELSHAIDAIEDKTQTPFVEEVRWDVGMVASITQSGRLTIGEPTLELAEKIGNDYFEWVLAHEQDHYVKGDCDYNLEALLLGQLKGKSDLIRKFKTDFSTPSTISDSLLAQLPDREAVEAYLANVDAFLTSAHAVFSPIYEYAQGSTDFRSSDRYEIVQSMIGGDSIRAYFSQTPQPDDEQQAQFLERLANTTSSYVPWKKTEITRGDDHEHVKTLLQTMATKHESLFEMTDAITNFIKEFSYAKELRCDMRKVELADDLDRSLEISEQANAILALRDYRNAMEGVGYSAEDFDALPKEQRQLLARNARGYRVDDIPDDITHAELDSQVKLYKQIDSDHFEATTHPANGERNQFMVDYAGGLQDALAERGLTWAERMQPSSKTEVGDPAPRIQSGNPQQHSR